MFSGKINLVWWMKTSPCGMIVLLSACCWDELGGYCGFPSALSISVISFTLWCNASKGPVLQTVEEKADLLRVRNGQVLFDGFALPRSPPLTNCTTGHGQGATPVFHFFLSPYLLLSPPPSYHFFSPPFVSYFWFVIPFYIHNFLSTFCVLWQYSSSDCYNHSKLFWPRPAGRVS